MGLSISGGCAPPEPAIESPLRKRPLRSGLTLVIEKGTIAPGMSTAPFASKLSTGLFGRTRRAVLAQLYAHPDEAYYLRQLVRSVGLGLGSVQREVARLAGAGIIQRTARGRQVYYQANPE